MLKILRFVFAIPTGVLAVYGLITQKSNYQSIMLLFLSLFILVLGLEEFGKGKRKVGWFLIAVFLFGLYVSIEEFLLS